MGPMGLYTDEDLISFGPIIARNHQKNVTITIIFG